MTSERTVRKGSIKILFTMEQAINVIGARFL